MTKRRELCDEGSRLLPVQSSTASLFFATKLKILKNLLAHLLKYRSSCLIIETALEISEILEREIKPHARNTIGISTAGFSTLSISPELYHSLHMYRKILKNGHSLNSGQWLHFVFTITSFVSFVVASLVRISAIITAHHEHNAPGLEIDHTMSVSLVPEQNYTDDFIEWLGLGSFAFGVLCDNIASTIGGIIPHPTFSNTPLQNAHHVLRTIYNYLNISLRHRPDILYSSSHLIKPHIVILGAWVSEVWDKKHAHMRRLTTAHANNCIGIFAAISLMTLNTNNQPFSHSIYDYISLGFTILPATALVICNVINQIQKLYRGQHAHHTLTTNLAALDIQLNELSQSSPLISQMEIQEAKECLKIVQTVFKKTSFFNKTTYHKIISLLLAREFYLHRVNLRTELNAAATASSQSLFTNHHPDETTEGSEHVQNTFFEYHNRQNLINRALITKTQQITYEHAQLGRTEEKQERKIIQRTQSLRDLTAIGDRQQRTLESYDDLEAHNSLSSSSQPSESENSDNPNELSKWQRLIIYSRQINVYSAKQKLKFLKWRKESEIAGLNQCIDQYAIDIERHTEHLGELQREKTDALLDLQHIRNDIKSTVYDLVGITQMNESIFHIMTLSCMYRVIMNNNSSSMGEGLSALDQLVQEDDSMSSLASPSAIKKRSNSLGASSPSSAFSSASSSSSSSSSSSTSSSNERLAHGYSATVALPDTKIQNLYLKLIDWAEKYIKIE